MRGTVSLAFPGLRKSSVQVFPHSNATAFFFFGCPSPCCDVYPPWQEVPVSVFFSRVHALYRLACTHASSHCSSTINSSTKLVRVERDQYVSDLSHSLPSTAYCAVVFHISSDDSSTTTGIAGGAWIFVVPPNVSTSPKPFSAHTCMHSVLESRKL